VERVSKDAANGPHLTFSQLAPFDTPFDKLKATQGALLEQNHSLKTTRLRGEIWLHHATLNWSNPANLPSKKKP
jgi:hypothetical protein